MSTDGPVPEPIAAVLPELLARLPDVELVYLFGSQASGALHPESDVDLAALPATALGQLARFELAQDLADRLGREVDLVDLRTASTVLKYQVVVHGVVLYARTPTTRAAFEGRVFSEYVRLNEERRPILERIAREQRVHG